MKETTAGYRPDIDGLRALAVTSVVAYHVGLPGVAGGFVGVDIFFVISGFLITGLLLDEVRTTGTIDLLAFYARRARRLLPAFFLVLAVTSILAALFLLPVNKEMSRFGTSAIHAALYVSNFYFARTGGGYFAAPTEMFPLLHTWSLAVEEQFYLIWPCVLVLLTYLTRSCGARYARHVLALLTVIFVASFATSWWGSNGEGEEVQAAFYLIFSRAWELAIGAFLAWALPYVVMRSRVIGESLCVVGLAAITAAIATLDATAPYPGVAALLPTLGTAALIAGGTIAPRSWCARLLASPPAVAVGLLSYSWYLWHWPLLALARTETLGERILVRDVGIGVLALGLAWLTYRLIEKPIRSRQVWGAWSSRKVLGVAAAVTVLMVGSAAAFKWWEHSSTLDPASRFRRLHQAARDVNPRRGPCNHRYPFTGLAAPEACTFPPGQPQRQIMVWGDSHGDHLMPLLEAVAPSAGLSVYQRSFNGCPPLLGVMPTRNGRSQSGCDTFNQAVLAEIRERRGRGLAGVVLSARWAVYDGRPSFSVHEQGRRMRFIKHAGDTDAPLEVLEAALKHTLATLTGMGLRVVVVAPVPEQRYNAPWCLARSDAATCSVPKQEAERDRADVLAAMSRAVAGASSVRLADPFGPLCDARLCPVERGGAILYSDDDHLSATGARSLAPWFAEAAAWLAGSGKVADAESQRR
jgi:peptidoglycan/LPS O-acetylase OafA/YrhL